MVFVKEIIKQMSNLIIWGLVSANLYLFCSIIIKVIIRLKNKEITTEVDK